MMGFISETILFFSQQRHALQILLYYDDFETANPLGSKKGIHKLGCVYFTLKKTSHPR